MTKHKFTPPTSFPAEYVDGDGNKAVVLGRGPHEMFPFIGHNETGHARYWTEDGMFSSFGMNGGELHDIPKRITLWYNVYDTATSSSYKSRKEADRFAQKARICVYRIEYNEDGGNPEIFVEEV